MSEPEALPETLLVKLRISIPGYELLDRINAGGQATVYRARELSSGLTVAIKVLHGGPLADESSRQRLIRETATLKALNHPNIVFPIELGRTPIGLDYLVMSYVDGRPLDGLWKDAAFAAAVAPEPPARLRLFKRICDIVQAAHLKGITHRDLSPSNILIDSTGEPHLLDFGLASTAFNKMLNPAGTSVSLSGQFLGKLQYAAPEQVTGGRDAVDIRTDVYALGVILYQILTSGILPYEVGDSLADAIKNIVHARPLPPSSILAANSITASRRTLKKGPALVNPTIEAIVLRALEKEKADRYQSAGELAADIDQYFAGRPTAAEARRDPPSMTARWKRLAPAALLMVLLLAVGIPGWQRLTRWAWVATSKRPSGTSQSTPTLPAEVMGSTEPPTQKPGRPTGEKPGATIVSSPATLNAPLVSGRVVEALPADSMGKIPDETWVSLFVDKDLHGWKIDDPSNRPNWKPQYEKGRFSLTANGDTVGVILNGADSRGYKLRIEVSGSADVRAWVGVRLASNDGQWTGQTCRIEAVNNQVISGHIGPAFGTWQNGIPNAENAAEPGEFFTMEFDVSVDDRNPMRDCIWTRVNGKVSSGVVRDTPHPGTIGFFVASGTLVVRKAEIFFKPPNTFDPAGGK